MDSPARLAKVRELAPLEIPADPSGMAVRAMAAGLDGSLTVAIAVKPEPLLSRETSSQGRILRFDAAGRQVATWPVDRFVPQAVAVSPDGNVYVGGQGRLASYSPDGKPSWSVELQSVGKLDLARSLALKHAPGVRLRTIENIQPIIKQLDRSISAGEALVAKDQESSIAERVKLASETRSELVSRLAELQKLPPAEWEQDLVADKLQVQGIAPIDDEVFVLNCGTIERFSKNGTGSRLIAIGTMNAYQIRSSSNGFALTIPGGQIFDYGRDGTRLRTIIPSAKDDVAISDSVLDSYEIGSIEADRLILLDPQARVGVWTTSGKQLSTLFEATKETGLTGSRILEVDIRSKRIYVGGEGDRKILRLEYPAAVEATGK
jgi:hypothetical protein